MKVGFDTKIVEALNGIEQALSRIETELADISAEMDMTNRHLGELAVTLSDFTDDKQSSDCLISNIREIHKRMDEELYPKMHKMITALEKIADK